MAIFNPQVPETPAKEYLDYSKGISQPDANKTFGAVFAGLGDSITGITKGADFIVKTDIDKQAEAAVDKARDERTRTLQATKDMVIGTGNPASSYASADPKTMDLFAQTPGWTQSIPGSLKGAMDRAGILQDARNNGKISNTQYDMEMVAINKNIRSQYPGYRDYIDKKMEDITGGISANTVVKSLIQDLNTYAENSRSERDKIRNLILSPEGMRTPDAPAIFQGFTNGTLSAQSVVEWYAKRQAQFGVWEWQEKERAGNKAGREEDSIKAKTNFNDMVNTMAGNGFENLQLVAGWDTPKAIEDKLNTNGQFDNNKAVEAMQALSRQKSAVFRQAWDWANRKDASGNSIRSTVEAGGGDISKLINDNLVIYDHVMEKLNNKDYGALHAAANQLKTMQDNYAVKMFKDPTMGPYFQYSNFLEKHAPVMLKEFFQRFLQTNIPAGHDAWLKREILGAASNSGQGSAVPTTKTYLDTINEAKGQKVQYPALYNSLNDAVNILSNPKAELEAKKNISNFFFDPKNAGALSNFKNDGVDPQTGNRIPGKYSVYAKLGSREVTDAMWELGKSDRQHWINYKNWMETEFGTQLFDKDIKDVDQIPNWKNVSIEWNPERNQFGMTVSGNKDYLYNPGTPNRRGATLPSGLGGDSITEPRPADQVLEPTAKMLRRLNWGIQQLSYVAEKEGTDTSAYLIRRLNQLGYTGERKTPDTIPALIYKALENSILPTIKYNLAPKGNL